MWSDQNHTSNSMNVVIFAGIDANQALHSHGEK